MSPAPTRPRRALAWALAASIAAAACAPSAAATPQEDLRGLVRALRKERDEAPPELFARIAAVGGEEALDALREGFGLLRGSPALDAAARAIGSLPRDDNLLRRGLAFLGNAAIGDAREAARRAAVRGLLSAANSSEEWVVAQLERVLGEARDPAVRGLAVDPLVAALGTRGDPLSIGWIVGQASLEAEPFAQHLGVDAARRERLGWTPFRDVVREALAGAREGESFAVLRRGLVEPGTPRRWRLFLIEILSERAGYAVTEALAGALADRDPGVVLAALLALEGRQDEAEIAPAIQPLVRAREAAVRRAALAALGTRRLGDPSWPEELLALAAERDAPTRMGAAIALAHLRSPEAVDALHGLLGDRDAPVRLEALAQVGNLRRKESIPFLLTRFEAEQGRYRADVHAVLRLLTGLDLGRSPERWRSWWQGEGGRFELPTLAAARAAEERRGASGAGGTQAATFYGLDVVSQRVAFVLDTSGSMRLPALSYADRPNPDGSPPTRMDVAREQLMEALRRLPDGDFFNVVFFETHVTSLESRLTRMTPTARQRALRFVRDQVSLGSTALYPALELAFADPLMDTLYVLTDGAPTDGSITDIAEIRAEVARWNGPRRVRIHGIAMGEDSTLLRWLAADSGGTYRRIE